MYRYFSQRKGSRVFQTNKRLISLEMSRSNGRNGHVWHSCEKLKKFVATHTRDDINRDYHVNGCFPHYPLHAAALDDCVSCASLLIDSDAQINIVNCMEMRALDYAVHRRTFKVAYLLLDRGGIGSRKLPEWAEQFIARRAQIHQQTLTWLKCALRKSSRNIKRTIGHDMVREIAKVVWEERFQ